MLRSMIVSLFVLISLLGVGSALMPQSASAASAAACVRGSGSGASFFLGFPTWYKYLDGGWNGTECVVNFDFTQPRDFSRVALAIFEIVLRIGGIAAVVFIVVGGFQYLTSTGEPDKVAGARTTIMNAIIGMFLTIMASAIVNLIGRAI